MQEEIIRSEALDFQDEHFQGVVFRGSSIDLFHKIKNRLYDFYSPESKAIFLDEIKKKINDELIDHRNLAHQGKPGENCQSEEKIKLLTFYIQQEIDHLPTVVQPSDIIQPKHDRKSVFVSYSHQDKTHLEEIKRYFAPFKGRINLWSDTEISPGTKWKEAIEGAINEAKVAILLVSTDFLASDFVAKSELPLLFKAAENDGATILTVVLSPCAVDMFPEIAQYQAMNAFDKPVSKMSDNDRQEFYVNLLRQTLKVLDN